MERHKSKEKCGSRYPCAYVTICLSLVASMCCPRFRNDVFGYLFENRDLLISEGIVEYELSSNLRFYVDNSIKNAMELTRKLENYEKELGPEKKIMKVFIAFTLFLASITTYLLLFVTSSSYGKLLWYPFAVVSSATIAVSVAYYWYKRGKLNKFTALFMSILFSATNILPGLIA